MCLFFLCLCVTVSMYLLVCGLAGGLMADIVLTEREDFTVSPLYAAMYKLPHHETLLLLSHTSGFGCGIDMLGRWLVCTEISHQISDELWTWIYVLMAPVVPQVFIEHHPQCAESYASPLSARQFREDKWSDTKFDCAFWENKLGSCLHSWAQLAVLIVSCC